MEAIAERPDGTRVWFTPYPTLLQDAEGRIVGGINMLVDITARKRADEALRETHLRLQRRTIELEQAVNIKTVELLQSQERLRALTTELNLTEHRERARLATELHDHLQQMLVLGKLKLGKRLAETVPVAAKLMREVDDVLSDALKYT
jgi:signal transduction histidine kinase